MHRPPKSEELHLCPFGNRRGKPYHCRTYIFLPARRSHIPSIPISPTLEFSFQGDALSGFFVTVISILTLSVSIYSIGYTKNIDNKGLMGFLYNLFILSMYAVILSGNIITFLVSWETMSVVSYFLVTFDRDEKSAKAGLMYAVMTHIGTAFIIALFLVLYKYTGHMDFSGIRAHSPHLCLNDYKDNCLHFFNNRVRHKGRYCPSACMASKSAPCSAFEYLVAYVRRNDKDRNLRFYKNKLWICWGTARTGGESLSL